MSDILDINTMTPCAKWTDDCQGKKDFDGSLISISTRYWPSGGGFHRLTVAAGQLPDFRLNDDPSIKPSAHAALHIDFGEPDEHGNGEYFQLVDCHFEGATEQEVKSQVEKWVTEKVREVALVLTKHFEIKEPA